jgi:hypothetical protein
LIGIEILSASEHIDLKFLLPVEIIKETLKKRRQIDKKK